jgi:hypothetical protein
VLHKSVPSRTCNNKCKINFRWYLQHLEFSSESRNHSTDVRGATQKFPKFECRSLTT